jgi:pimeloyl-ACP methyl ester carboxylesterase
LIHGGGHGSWCWDKVVPLLQEKGHLVEAPDLPGHGKNKTPIQEVTLQSCVDKVCNIINTQSEPVILVGHSLGGIVISQVAEQIPNKIKILVYLAANLVKDGESMATKFGWFLLQNQSQDQSYLTMKSELAADLLYNDCSADDISRAKALLGPDSIAVFKTPVHISNERFGRVPRIYIECLCDKIIPPQLAKEMYTVTPCQKVISLNTGHSPFLSSPKQLATCLLSLAK